MTNSIWHKASEKPELNKYVVVRKHGFAQWKVFKFDNKTTFYEPFTDDLWAYVADIIAQADKAERLQKAVDNSREKLAAFMHDVWGNWFAYQLNNSTVENLQRWGIQSNTPYSSLTETDKDKDRKFADQIIGIIKDEIKQLIKGE